MSLLVDHAGRSLEPRPQHNTGLNIYQRMLAVMRDIDSVHKAGTAKLTKKDGTFAGKYNFVSHNDVARALHDLVVKHGIYPKPDIVSWEHKGNAATVTLELSFINVDCPSDRDVQHYPGIGVDGSDKASGKATSYAYKVGLLKAFMLESSDEDNEKNTTPLKLGVPGDNGQLPPDPEELAAELMESLAKARTHQQVDAVKKEVVRAKKQQLLQPKMIDSLVKMGQKRREELGSPKEENGANAG